MTLPSPRLSCWLLLPGGVLAALLLVLAIPAAAQTPAPLVVEGDEVIYDDVAQVVEATGRVRLSYRGIRVSAARVVFHLQTRRLTASGGVVLVDADGREVRGETLAYDVDLQLAEVSGAETIVDGVYVRSARLIARPDRVEATESVATTCDPARPAYRVTAASIEIIPGERLTARQASLWLGRHRILSLPVLTVSLRSQEETAQSFPRAGYNTVDGLWVDYRFRPAPGTFPWYVSTRLGTLAQRIEAGVEVSTSLGPVTGLFAAGYGWHREAGVGVSTTRLIYAAELRTTAPLRLGERTIWSGSISFSDAQYGTGDRQSVVQAAAGLTHRLSETVSVELSYTQRSVRGATPLAFDAVAVEDLIHRTTLQVVRTGRRAGEIATRLALGGGYNFSDATPFALLGYGERTPGRYHWHIGTEYNLTTQAQRIFADLGGAVGPGTYLTLQAAYDPPGQRFADLDLLLTARLCDCFDLSLVYRAVRQEIWITLTLAPVQQERRGSP